MTDTLKDLLGRIDDVTADVCGWCQATLDDTAYSRLSCSQDHQARWQAQQAGVDPDPELLEGDLPLRSLRSLIASQLSQRIRGAQVFVNGNEMHVLGARVDFVWVDEITQVGDQPNDERRLLEGDWDFGLVDADATVAFPGPIPIGEVFNRLADHIPGFLDGIRAATPHDGKPPADPRARALWLQRNRNTGPKPRRQRPPKNLAR